MQRLLFMSSYKLEVHTCCLPTATDDHFVDTCLKKSWYKGDSFASCFTPEHICTVVLSSWLHILLNTNRKKMRPRKLAAFSFSEPPATRFTQLLDLHTQNSPVSKCYLTPSSSPLYCQTVLDILGKRGDGWWALWRGVLRVVISMWYMCTCMCWLLYRRDLY